MSWNYRIIRHQDGSHALHEVYYEEDETPRCMTKEPITFSIGADETVPDLVSMLERALNDARTRLVIRVEDIQRSE